MRGPETWRNAVAISYGGGDQTFSAGFGPCEAIYCGSNGNLAVRLAGDAADVTLTGLLSGNVYRFNIAVIRQTGSTITSSLALWGGK